MIIERQQDVTVAATSVMERTSDPRLREIMVSLVNTCTALSATSA
jgi:catechol 1,2-dioxygenase